MVVIKFSSALRLATGGRRQTIIEGGGTVAEIIIHLCDQFGKEFSNRILENGQPRAYLNFYVNGQDIRFLNNLGTIVNNQDTVDIIPAVAGG